MQDINFLLSECSYTLKFTNIFSLDKNFQKQMKQDDFFFGM